MGKKVVVLNGSPRAKGNTAGLIEVLSDGARKAGHEVRAFMLAKMDIHECLGCFGGDSGCDHPCVQRGGMDEVYPAVREADVVVMPSPLYYWTISGALRTAFDRLFALEEGGENLLRGHGKEGIPLMAAEGDDFADAVSYFDHLMGHLRWKNCGHVLAGGRERYR